MITKADKGSGIVVCDYDTYVKKGTNYIEEEAGAYSKVGDTEVELVARLIKQRNKIVEKLRKESVIPLQTATFCMKQVEEKITGMKFYFKIHKDQNVTTTPLRPLQSCIAAPTHHLSLVLTDILQPLLTTKNIPSFIYDSNHLLFRLQTLGAIPKDCTIISSDVSALYPSIPHQQGLEAIQSFLTSHTQYDKPQIEIIMQALKLVISENYVMWNDSIYKQTSGVAMGTPVAVAYANIFMAWVDRKVRHQVNYIHEHIRFIDDNLFIIPEEKIDDLMQLANNILPSIKYTYEKLDKNSNKGLAFLDTQLFVSEQGHIEARLYTKPTDRHAYLLPSSYHPPHIVKNIPSAVFKRLRRICSRKEWFLEDAEKAKNWLKNRGYKEREVDKALDTAANLDRWDMIVKIEVNRGIEKTSVENMYRIPFIVTYSKYAKVFKQVLTRRQELLNSSYKHSKVQPRVTFRRQKNLDDLLIQKALRGPIRKVDQEEHNFVKCGEKQQYRGMCPCKEPHEPGMCRYCAHASFETVSSKVKLRKKVDCNTKNVVYLIGCKKCAKRYIGETQQTIRDRLAQHLNNIAKLNQPLYLHFRLVHSPSNLFITVLETVKTTEQFFRKVREAWWINHLQTLEPKGFNAKLDCNQIYQENLR